MASYRLAPVVEGELDDIWVYVARDKGSFEVASDVIASLEERFRALAAHPYIGRQRDYDIGPGVRSFPSGEFVILYCIEAGEVLILHVVHGRRDVAGLYGRN